MEKNRSRKKTALISGGIFILAAGCLAGFLLTREDGEETVYREEQVQYGELTVGLEASGNVTVGTTEQTFDLDISAYSGSGDGFSWGQGGDLFSGFAGAGDQNSSSARVLEIGEVYVTTGQEVEIGDALYKLTADSVDSIRSELSGDVEEARVTLEQTLTQQTLSQLEASQTYETAVTYGGLAQTEYDSAVRPLEEAVEEITERAEELTEELAELNETLAGYQADLETQKQVLANAEYLVETTDILTAAYSWVTAEEAREDAAGTVENLEESIEEAQERIADKTRELEELQNSLTGAQRDLELGIIDAQAQMDLRNLNYENASERYSVSVELSEYNARVAQEEYDEAAGKLSEFDSYLADGTILSEYRGVVTEVSLAVGDAVNTDSVVVVLSDYDEVTAAVSVEEGDLANIREGDAVKVSVSAYPDLDFTGEVEEIGESVYNSQTGTSYADVTVRLGGDTGRLYEGMTVEITFITKETREVLYVSNRAVTRENGRSYVKKKEEDGTIVTQEVTTGFSDGTCVEIIEGLSEGDTVLIESKVGNS